MGRFQERIDELERENRELRAQNAERLLQVSELKRHLGRSNEVGTDLLTVDDFNQQCYLSSILEVLHRLSNPFRTTAAAELKAIYEQMRPLADQIRAEDRRKGLQTFSVGFPEPLPAGRYVMRVFDHDGNQVWPATHCVVMDGE